METYTTNEPKEIGIVGGGMLGLTMALKLAQDGHKVTLVEAEPDLGGLASSNVVGGMICDRYYHVTMLSDKHLRDLLKELDLDKQITWKTTKTQFYTGTEVVPLNNVFDYFALPVLGLIDKIRLAFNIVYASKLEDGVYLERFTAEEWLTKYSGKKTYENLWKPLLKAKLGSNYDKVSASFIWSVIRRFYAARRGGLKTEMFGYVPGGYARIIKTLAAKLKQYGVKIESDTWVNSYEKYKGQFILDTNRGLFDFDKLIVTVPSPHVLKMCRQLTLEEQRLHKAMNYQGVICVTMAVKRSFGGAYLTYIRDHRIPFTALIEMSALVDYGMKDRHLIYLPRYVSQDDPILEDSDNLIAEQFIHGLMLMFSFFQPEDVIDFQVSRNPHVVALSELDHSEYIPPMTTSDKDLFVINSVQINNAALSVNETVNLAERGCQCIRQALEK